MVPAIAVTLALEECDRSPATCILPSLAFELIEECSGVRREPAEVGRREEEGVRTEPPLPGPARSLVTSRSGRRPPCGGASAWSLRRYCETWRVWEAA
jgi:hypothetical protein